MLIPSVEASLNHGVQFVSAGSGRRFGWGPYAAIRALLVVRVPYSRLLKKAGFVGYRQGSGNLKSYDKKLIGLGSGLRVGSSGF